MKERCREKEECQKEECEKEEQVAATLCGASPNTEILAHARSCPVCFELLLVAGLLREQTTLAQRELSTLPDAGLIWRKAQALAREKALARATLPIRIARICASVLAILAAPWLILESRPLWPGIAELWPIHPSPTNLPSDLNQTALLLAVTGTLVLIGLSSWYMLRED
jgi:hypothetical protein